MTDADLRRLGRLKVAAVVVLVLALVAFVVQGANQPADPTLAPPGAADRSGGRAGMDGFGEVAVTVAPPGGGLLQWCMLLAATLEQRQRGLMEVEDPTLGGYDGMLFRLDRDSTTGFYMRNTPMPLTIAYVDADGRLVSTEDMEPCEDREGCPTYPPAGPYRYAVEVPRGGLTRLGLTEGSVLTDTREVCADAWGG